VVIIGTQRGAIAELLIPVVLAVAGLIVAAALTVIPLNFAPVVGSSTRAGHVATEVGPAADTNTPAVDPR
jgi:hypothetical protein